MCTLAIVRLDKKIVFTSNRDDKTDRTSNRFIEKKLKEKTIFYPQDGRNKGSWFAFDSEGKVVILLNGAKIKHEKACHHTQSRGSIVVDMISSDFNLKEAFSLLALENTEPFTLVIYEDQSLYQALWDGRSKEFNVLPNDREWYLWSSVTLYDQEAREEREQNFNNFIKTGLVFPETIFEFLSTPSPDTENGYMIQRMADIQTLSTSQLTLSESEGSFLIKNHIEQNIDTVRSVSFKR